MHLLSTVPTFAARQASLRAQNVGVLGEEQSPNCFVMTFDGEEHGLACDIEGADLKVKGIIDRSQATLWNEAHPEKQVQVGDCIVAVDGKHGGPGELVISMFALAPGQHELKIRRGATLTSIPQDVAPDTGEWETWDAPDASADTVEILNPVTGSAFGRHQPPATSYPTPATSYPPPATSYPPPSISYPPPATSWIQQQLDSNAARDMQPDSAASGGLQDSAAALEERRASLTFSERKGKQPRNMDLERELSQPAPMRPGIVVPPRERSRSRERRGIVVPPPSQPLIDADAAARLAGLAAQKSWVQQGASKLEKTQHESRPQKVPVWLPGENKEGDPLEHLTRLMAQGHVMKVDWPSFFPPRCQIHAMVNGTMRTVTGESRDSSTRRAKQEAARAALKELRLAFQNA